MDTVLNNKALPMVTVKVRVIELGLSIHLSLESFLFG